MNESAYFGGDRSYGVSDFIRALFRNKKKVIFAPLSVLGLATLIILFAPRKYRSEAKVYMQVGRESVKLDPTATTGDTISLQSSSRDSEIVTAMESLKSRGTIEKVVDKLGPNVVLGRGGVGKKKANMFTDALKASVGRAMQVAKSIDPVSDRERAVIKIERNLAVDAENNSTLITTSYDAETPQLAQLVVQTLIEVYEDEHLRLHRTTGSKEFFTQQHDEIKVKLDDSLDKLRIARNRLNLVSIESRRGTLESRMGQIELALYSNLQQLAVVRARVADIKKQLAATPDRVVSAETTVPNTGTDLLREQVFTLQVLLLDLEAKYNEDHPSLQAARKQLDKAEAMLKTESIDRQQSTNDINPNHRTLSLSLAQEESQLAGYIAQSNMLNEQRAAVIADLKSINDNALEIDTYNRESQLARTNFFRYAENLEQTRINEALDEQQITNAIRAQNATLAEKPISPNKFLIASLAILISITSVVPLVLISEKLNNPIYDENQLEDSLRLPVFGVLPEKKRYLKTTA